MLPFPNIYIYIKDGASASTTCQRCQEENTTVQIVMHQYVHTTQQLNKNIQRNAVGKRARMFRLLNFGLQISMFQTG